MIRDPLTLGRTGNEDVFDLITNGPGSKTSRLSDTTPGTGVAYVYSAKTLTISHETTKSRRRSLFRLDYEAPFTSITLGTPAPVAPPIAYLVVDQPLDGLSGDTKQSAQELLSRILAFLNENAVAADYTMQTQPTVVEWLRGEP